MLACCVLPAHLQGATVILSASRDTALFEQNSNYNLGSNDLIAGVTARYDQRARSLIQFNVTALIPAGSTITGATLELNLISQAASHSPGSYQLRRFLKDWQEGVVTVKNGSTAAAGDSTWNSQFQGTTLWSTPGGQAGVEYAATPSAVGASVDVGVGLYSFSSNSALIADVQAWLDTPSANYGWYLLTSDESVWGNARRFAASENANATLTPRLVIAYNAAPEPSHGLLLLVGAGGLICRRSRRWCRT